MSGYRSGFEMPYARALRARYDRSITRSVIEPPPIIILGHWRTGTTHLHNLLGRDPANTYSSMYQVVFPTTFVSTSRTFFPKITAALLSETRGFDNMANGWDEPAEDVPALAEDARATETSGERAG